MRRTQTRKLHKPTESRPETTTYLFKVDMKQEEDGRWSTWIKELPGCAAWGRTQKEALKAIQDAAEVYIEDIIEAGETLPAPRRGKRRVTLVEAPAVHISL
jgi:predicted RNase H-like HicB family nuclease